MRTITAGTITNMDSERIINARLTIRDTIPHFETFAITDTAISAGTINYDSSTYNNGILRVLNYNNSLYYQWSADPGTAWGTWGAVPGVSLEPNSKPGLFENYVYYQDTNNNYYYKSYNSGTNTWGTAVQITPTGADTSVPAAFAPVDTDKVFIYWVKNNGDDVYIGRILFHNRTAATTSTWGGATYYNTNLNYFDAVDDGSDYYIFVNEPDENKIKYLTYRNLWGQLRDVFPLDFIDTTSSVRFGGVSMIDSEMLITGSITRPSGAYYTFYSFGPNFTLGRESYVGSTYQAHANKMHYVDNYMYFVGVGSCWRAVPSKFFGVDTASLKTSYIYPVGFSMNMARNSATQLAVEIPASETSTLIKNGSEIQLEIAYDDVWATLGYYTIDAVQGVKANAGEEQRILARSTPIKSLMSWTSDADYDYWATAKQACVPSELTEMVSAQGNWGVQNGDELILEQLNYQGFLYSTERPSAGGVVKARFSYPSSTYYYPEFGVMLNFYRDTKQEAAERLDIDIDYVTEWNYGINGIVFYWSPVAHGGSPGYALSRVYPGMTVGDDKRFTSIQTWSGSPVADLWYWLMMTYHDGEISCYWRLDSSTGWTKLGTVLYDLDDLYPTYSDGRGRAGIYMNNKTLRTQCLTMNTQATMVPWGGGNLSEFTAFPSSDTLLIDSEQITYSSKTATAPEYGGQTVVNGQYFWDDYNNQEPPWSNTYQGPFTGNEIWLNTSPLVVYDHNYYDNMAACVRSGPGAGNVFKITDWDCWAPEQWIPSGTYTEPDAWENHIGDTGYGSWSDLEYHRIFVEEDISGKVGEGAIVSRTKAWNVTSRGANGTTATSHSDLSFVHLYRDVSVACDFFEYYSIDDEYSFTDMARELARKASIRVPTFEMHHSGTMTFTNGYGTNLDDQMNDNGRAQPYCNVTMDIPSSRACGVFRGNEVLSGQWDGVAVLVSSAGIYKYTVDNNVFTLTDLISQTITGSNRVKIVAQKEFFTLWINDRLVMGFSDPAWSSSMSTCVIASAATSFDVQWPALDMPIDSFIMDMGKDGMSLLKRLIGEKRIYFQSDQALYFLRNRTVINSGSPYVLAIQNDEDVIETKLINRIRIEGAEITEQMDHTSLKEHGNLFAMINLSELDDIYQFNQEAGIILTEALETLKRTNYTGAVDPRLEADDIISATIPSADRTDTRNIIADSVTFTLEVTEHTAKFDMEVTGHDES